jgi:hypothetical protein
VSNRIVGLLLLSIISAVPPSLTAQSDSALAWVREAPSRARKLAGCYLLMAPIKDSIEVPASFQLSSTRVRALGYHRVAHFWTNLPRLQSAETRPIWTPRTDDSLEIELAPHSTGVPRFIIALRVTGDSVRGEFQDRSWIRDTTRPLGVRVESMKSLPISGARVKCNP